MAGSLEIRLFNFIKELHQEIVNMKPEGGFSSPRDYELVTEVNKKSAIFDKLQEAMRIYNPGFEYEQKQEGQKDFNLATEIAEIIKTKAVDMVKETFKESSKDFSKNPRFDTDWKEKQIAYSKEDISQDYINVWGKIKNVQCPEELMVAHEFSFNSNTNIKMVIPNILKEIESKDMTFDELFLFSLMENSFNHTDITIPYEELRILFKYCSSLDIDPLKNMLKDYSLIVLTKSNNPDKVRFVFKILF